MATSFFDDIGTAFRHLLFGRTPEENANNKQAIEETQKSIDDNVARNGYYNPLEAIPGYNTTNYIFLGLIVVAGVMLLNFLFKE